MRANIGLTAGLTPGGNIGLELGCWEVGRDGNNTNGTLSHIL